MSVLFSFLPNSDNNSLIAPCKLCPWSNLTGTTQLSQDFYTYSYKNDFIYRNIHDYKIK